MRKTICLLIIISLAIMMASPLFAASNPQTTTPLAPKPDPKVPKNFEVYDQRVKEYNYPIQQHRSGRRDPYLRV